MYPEKIRTQMPSRAPAPTNMERPYRVACSDFSIAFAMLFFYRFGIVGLPLGISTNVK
jgi:hypothetical protein